MNKRSVLMAVSGLVALVASTGCIVDNSDYLSVNSWVVANDGLSQVVNLRIDTYNWYIRYNDGTYMDIPFSGTGSNALITGFSDDLVTPHLGNFGFTSYNLWLESGSPTETCDFVCTARDPDGYCYEWVQDCYDSTLTMDVTDIVASSASIDYRVGQSWITTDSVPSTEFTGPISATTWQQSDVFVTPFSAAAAKAAPTGNKKVVDAATYTLAMPASAAKRAVTYVSRADAKKLSADKKAIIAKARTHLVKKAE